MTRITKTFEQMFNEAYGALDFSGILRGNQTDPSLTQHFHHTLDDLYEFVAVLTDDERNKVRGLKLTDNAIDELDFPFIKDLLEKLLPNVRDLNLSFTAMIYTTGQQMQVLTRMPQLQSISIVGTVVSGYLGRAMFETLEAQDIRKMVFMTPTIIMSKAYMRIVPEYLASVALDTHLQIFREELDARKKLMNV